MCSNVWVIKNVPLVIEYFGIRIFRKKRDAEKFLRNIYDTYYLRSLLNSRPWRHSFRGCDSEIYNMRVF